MRLQAKHIQPVVMAAIMAWPLASVTVYIAAPIASKVTQRILPAL